MNIERARGQKVWEENQDFSKMGVGEEYQVVGNFIHPWIKVKLFSDKEESAGIGEKEEKKEREEKEKEDESDAIMCPVESEIKNNPNDTTENNDAKRKRSLSETKGIISIFVKKSLFFLSFSQFFHQLSEHLGELPIHKSFK